ncbi:uncharacterized protein [Blastocystis hominis]|uniref:Uncharacterized protein n=1 Tax=Blastocystis hominis TaxID=12968 RepID=D8LXQ0_BLAHO|nr:uncharacterized protein [Blastocystis hominis]XP_012897836.1 uncharacterized protein [Blastocystis hominis]CBK20355.2 unnamed protein product [Blastocystis hominis]CBK23788.2 unnamed protein product [Blastocystis hominis]|eukprot:XP_012894403.1 uncharacterized protein [Blastocystis hominis]
MTERYDQEEEIMNGKCNAAYDLSRKMAPFFDIHIMLFIFNWLEKTNISYFQRWR